ADATIVEAAVRRPPQRRGPGARSETDPDAAWTRRGREAYFGYKAHIGMDGGSGLIRKALLTPANVNESEVADRLLSGDEAALYADKAYESKARRARLRSRGVKDRIMHRSHKNQRALPHWQRRRNALIAPLRAPVEQVFGTLKRGYGYRRVRYLGLRRNATELWLKCTAYNLRRAVSLLASAPV
ncbi:MAG: IS5 family transposase, partial [Chloroflexi bacterium]|nr:IS5 family transposase [Chloroflexota bacterium]